jgi:hypothetical protein
VGGEDGEGGKRHNVQRSYRNLHLNRHCRPRQSKTMTTAVVSLASLRGDEEKKKRRK